MAGTTLQDPVQFAKGVGPARAPLFERLGASTIEELLYLFPRDYLDVRTVTPLERLVPGRIQVSHVRLEYISERLTRAGQPLVKAGFSDPTGYLSVVWFNRPSVLETLKLEETYRVIGVPKRAEGRWLMSNPQIEVPGAAEPHGFGPGLVPVYPLTEGLNAAAMRRIMFAAVDSYAGLVADPLPEPFRNQRGLVGIHEALCGIHRPADWKVLERSKRRLIVDELLSLATALAVKRAGLRRRPAFPIAVPAEIDRRIRARFPFPLTPDQDRAVEEIVADLAQTVPMYRLLQGDVGSGKTAVAVYAMLAAVGARLQTALVAPTEVLARQHFRTIGAILEASRVRTALLTGSLTEEQRARTHAQLADGSVDLVVGTHALLQEGVSFARLGLVAIDEQHKFGVRQRASFQRLERPPHQLVMTATPIPRSLCMAWFGDLDVSILRNKPAGRQATLTYVVSAPERWRAYAFLARQIPLGGQGLVVCPRIEETDDAIQSVEQVAGQLATADFDPATLGVVHGRLADAEKEAIVRRFEAGELRILVSTVVVEVGLDIPTANIVVIENAERFGLAQLHQIRGRVGRGSRRGICFFICGKDDPATRERLDTLARTDDGFQIAELDANLRGVGEFIGARQHGSARFRLADLRRDTALVEQARRDAATIVAEDPSLQSPAWRVLRSRILETYAADFGLALVG